MKVLQYIKVFPNNFICQRIFKIKFKLVKLESNSLLLHLYSLVVSYKTTELDIEQLNYRGTKNQNRTKARELEISVGKSDR